MKKSKKMILIITILILGILLIIFSFVLNKPSIKDNDKDKNKDIPKLSVKEQYYAEEEVTKLIEDYIKKITSLQQYIELSDKKTFSIKELKNTFGIDISSFENLKYGCDADSTIADFSEGYDKYTLSIVCKAFMAEN